MSKLIDLFRDFAARCLSPFFANDSPIQCDIDRRVLDAAERKR
jgi:hypothetical protein